MITIYILNCDMNKGIHYNLETRLNKLKQNANLIRSNDLFIIHIIVKWRMLLHLYYHFYTEINQYY